MRIDSPKDLQNLVKLAGSVGGTAQNKVVGGLDTAVHGIAAVSHVIPGVNIMTDVLVAGYGGAKYGVGALLSKVNANAGAGLQSSGKESLLAAGVSIGGSVLNTFTFGLGDIFIGTAAHGAMVYRGVNNIRS